MPDRLVTTIRKNSREELRVAIRTFKGHRNVDVRVFAEDGRGDPRPTPKGVSIKPTLLRPVIEALEQAEQIAIAEGLIGGAV
jgi:hypothetical protein